MSILTARNASYRYLYHYQPYTADRLLQILRDRTIYLPRPSRFNDPWDCKPYFDLDSLGDPNVMAEHLDFFNDPKALSSESVAALKENPHLVRSHVRLITTLLTQRINERYRLYCLTPLNDSLLMWSHYARDHTGVCLEFDTSYQPVAGALQVEYGQALPVFSLPAWSGVLARKILLVKSRVWDYEEEFRIIATNDVSNDPLMPVAREGKLALVDGALTSVIVGCQSSNAEEIVEMVRSYQPATSVIQAVRDRHRYGIDFRKIYLCD